MEADFTTVCASSPAAVSYASPAHNLAYAGGHFLTGNALHPAGLNFRHALGWIGHDAFQDHAPVIQHPFHAAGLDEIRAVFGHAAGDGGQDGV